MFHCCLQGVLLILQYQIRVFAPVISSMKFARILKHLTINFIIFSEWYCLGLALSVPGLTISAKFRRNFGKFSVSASYRDPKFRYFSVYFVSKFKIQQISSKIHRNLPKFTEIPERNSVSGKHRDLTGKRKGEPWLRHEHQWLVGR